MNWKVIPYLLNILIFKGSMSCASTNMCEKRNDEERASVFKYHNHSLST